MIYIPNNNHDASLNLAMEEYILTDSGIQEPVLFFYINAPSIIIGRHQNTLDEINSDFVRRNHIQVVRRCSGGGAVYHDLGNLNYSLITPGAENTSVDFSILLVPILDALHDLNLPAEINGRNDLTLNGAKFSGNAYYHNRYGSVTHGTLLYDTDLEMLSKALLVRPEKLLSKGVSSVRSRVCCIKSSLPQIRNIELLEAAIVKHFSVKGNLETREFTPSDILKFTEIAEKRYRNDLWTYGESPAFTIRRTFRQPGGWIDFRVDIRGEKVHQVRFFGDFFCSGEISDLESALIGVIWEPEQIFNALHASQWQNYFPEFPLEEFIRIVFTGRADA